MSAIFTGKNLVHLDQVISTNTVLSEMLSNSKPLEEGSVILADEQTQGRGQQGSFWEAIPHKNITLSLLYRPEFLTIELQFYLSIAISLGISDFLEEELQQKSHIKWPNDIYFGNYKIAGILIENTLMNNHLKTSIIGIGLNVNQTTFNSDAPNPCSMKGIMGKEFSIPELLPRLFHHIEIHYLQLKAGKYEFLKEGYFEKLYRYELESYYIINGERKKGKIVDIETSGRLVLLVDGVRKSFDTKEIEYVL